ETWPGRLEGRVEIGAPVELDLQGMDPPGRSRVAFDHVAAGERIVESGFKAEPVGNRDGFAAQPCARSAAAAVADHDRRNALGRRRHGMAVEQERAAETVEKERDLAVDRFVIGPMRLDDPLLKLL